MIDPADFLLGGLLPAVVAAVALAIAWKLTHDAVYAGLAGVVLGYVTGHWALDAQGVGLLASVAKSFRPHEARDWLPLAVLLAVVPEIAARFGNRGSLLAWILRVALCVLLPWRMLDGSAYLPATTLLNTDFDIGAWSRSEAIGWLGGMGAVLLASWFAVRGCGEKSLSWLRFSLATFVALGGAATLAMSGSLSYGQLLGVLAATLVGCGLMTTILHLDSGPEAAAGPLLLAFGGVLVLAYFYSELKLLNAVLLLLAMIAAVGWVAGSQKLSQRGHASLRCVICLTALAAAVSLAAMDFTASQAETQNNPYLNFQQ